MLSRARTCDHPFSLLTPLLSAPSTITDCSSECTRRCDTRSTALPRSLTRTRVPRSNTECSERDENGLARTHTPPPPLFDLSNPFHGVEGSAQEKNVVLVERAYLPAGSDEFDYRTTPVDSAAPSRKRGETRAHTRGRNAPLSGQRCGKDKG